MNIRSYSIAIILVLCVPLATLAQKSSDVNIQRKPEKPNNPVKVNSKQYGEPLKKEISQSVPELQSSHHTGVWSHYTPANTGDNEVSGIRLTDVFTDSKDHTYIVGDHFVDIKTRTGEWEHWYSGEELSGDPMSPPVEGRNGDIYISTQDGVNRFSDMNRIDSKRHYFDYNLYHPEVLMFDSDNNLWMIHNRRSSDYNSNEGGVSVETDTGYVVFQNELAGDEVADLMEHDNGEIWVSIDHNDSTSTGGISIYDGSNWSTMDMSNSGLPSNHLGLIMQDSEGNIWVTLRPDNDTSPGGVVMYDGSSWNHMNDADGMTIHYPYSIMEGSDGRIYVGGDDLIAYNGSSWESVTNNNSRFPLSGIVDMYTGQFGKMHFVSNDFGNETHGVHTKHDSGWEFMSTQNDGGLHSDIIFGTAIDHNGNLWAGGFYGVNMYDGEEWTYYKKEDGLASNYVWKIVASSDSSVWLLNAENGITRYKDDTFNTITQYGTFVETGFEDSQGNMWFGSYSGNGILMYDGNSYTQFDTSTTILGERITAIGEDANGNILAASDGHVIQYDGNSWSKFTIDGNQVSANELASDDEGNVFIYSTGGENLIKWDGSQITDSYSSSSIAYPIHIEPASDGSVWLVGFNVNVLKNGEIFTFDGSMTGIGNNLAYVASTTNGGENIWIGSYRGGMAKYNNGQALAIKSVTDHPDDEGGFVTLTVKGYLLNKWRVSHSTAQTSQWTVWRQNGDNWENAKTVPLTSGGIERKVTVSVPTTRDSDANSGNEYLFKVKAHERSGSVLGASEVDTGYALDNLAPAKVQNVEFSATAEEELELSWDANEEKDLAGYDVYSYEDGNVDKSSAVATTTGNSVTLSGVNALARDYVVAAKDRHSNVGEVSDPIRVTDVEKNNLPDEFALKQSYPNPFNPRAVIPFTLPKASNVNIEVYNTTGSKVATLADEHYSPGAHKINFRASDLSSGIYIIRAELGEKSFQQKVTLVK